MSRSVFYAVIAPKWRAAGRPPPALNTRRWFRWEVVRETRPVTHADGITTSGYEHIGFYWTLGKAERIAQICTDLARYGSGEASNVG